MLYDKGCVNCIFLRCIPKEKLAWCKFGLLPMRMIPYPIPEDLDEEIKKELNRKCNIGEEDK